MRLPLPLALLVLTAVSSAAQPTHPKLQPATGPAPSVTAPAAKPAAAEPAGLGAENPPSGAHALDRADLEPWLDGFMPYALQTGDIAGGVVTVVKDGEIIFAKGYGYADVEAKKPVDPTTTMFRPGSVSKLLTWTAVMQLVGEGKLDLDKDVNEYLDFKIPARADGPITLRDIMTHTPGFEEQIKSLITADPKALIPLREYVKNSTPVRIYKASSTPAYSNYATALAGYLVEHVSGQSFDDYLDQHIFQPLEMEHSTFRQPLPQKFAADMAKGYRLASGTAEPYEIVVPAPAGSLAASGGDMAHFMIAHLQNGEYHGKRILPEQVARMMHETPRDMIPPLHRMMLGFYEQDYNGHRVISHGGDTQWMHSYLHLFPDDHVGIFMSFNSLGRDGAAGVVRQALFDQFVDRYFPGPGLAPVKVSPGTAAQHARLMAGYYDDSRRPERNFLNVLSLIAPVKVEADKDNHVTVSLIKGRNGLLRKYVEIEPFVWRDTGSNWRMAAKVDNGRVVRFSMDEVSPFMVFEPFDWWRSPAWIRPAVIVGLVAVVLTALLWPVAAIVRRRLKAPLALAGRPARARLYSRIAAAVLAGLTVTWIVLIMTLLEKEAALGPGLDPLLLLMYTLSLVGYLGATAVMLWSTYVTWTAARPWTARLWSLVLALSALALTWTAYTYHLMSFATKY